MEPLDFLPAVWRGFRRPDWPAASWRVERGVAGTVVPAERVDLVTRETFRDFEVELEWCVAAGGNTGILYRVGEEEAESWRTGPELQLIDDDRHPDRERPETALGALYGLLGPRVRPRCPAGSFHSARIAVRGTEVEHWLDGRQVLGYTIGGEPWERAVARSKFRDAPRFGRLPGGHLVLQHHGDPVWFRRVRVHRLPD